MNNNQSESSDDDSLMSSNESDMQQYKGQQEEDIPDKSSDEGKKCYSKIEFARRLLFIKKVLCEKLSVRRSAAECDIKFSTAKAILKIFKKEGRLGKKNKPANNHEEDLLREVSKRQVELKRIKAIRKTQRNDQLATQLSKVVSKDKSKPMDYKIYAQSLWKQLQLEQMKYQALTQQYNYLRKVSIKQES